MVVLFTALITFGISYEIHNIFYEKWPLEDGLLTERNS